MTVLYQIEAHLLTKTSPTMIDNKKVIAKLGYIVNLPIVELGATQLFSILGRMS